MWLSFFLVLPWVGEFGGGNVFGVLEVAEGKKMKERVWLHVGPSPVDPGY